MSWYLYLASPYVDDEGTLKAYRRVLATVKLLPDLWVDRFPIKLISPTHPLAVGAMQQQRPLVLTRIGGGRLGTTTVEGAVIYPVTNPVAVP